MPLLIVRNDITHMHVDAIVNAAKPSLLGGGGVDGAIHAAAGPELLEACKSLGGCPAGQVRLTPGFRLPCRWVIHTVGPVWQGGGAGERELLWSCYRNALELAESLGCETVAFPLISSGAYGYPKDRAVEVAREAIQDFLWAHEMQVYLVVYGEESLAASRKVFDQIREYIDSAYVRARPDRRNRPAARRESLEANQSMAEESVCASSAAFGAPAPAPEAPKSAKAPLQDFFRRKPKETAAPAPLPPCAAKRPDFAYAAEDAALSPFDSRFGRLDESFQQMLLRLIDQRGMTDAACYKRANIDRKLFSKIRKDVYYKPSKPTALAFAVALELELDETEELLEKAGFALSRSSRFDLIVRYFIERHIYDVFTINEALFEFDQALLGNVS
jgi:O-acetyl-ADP-ribose deacetylase (regulator of RNase III)